MPAALPQRRELAWERVPQRSQQVLRRVQKLMPKRRRWLQQPPAWLRQGPPVPKLPVPPQVRGAKPWWLRGLPHRVWTLPLQRGWQVRARLRARQ